MNRDRSLGTRLARGLAAAVLGVLAQSALAGDERLLETIAAQLDTAPVVVAEFTQTRRISGLNQPVVSSGQVVFARGRGLVWQIERPIRHAYVFSAQGLTEVDAKG
ncbi:MAG: outer membrane lipoprotein carrier protein LolA, partial [Burkholderiales bacterium]